jgi:Flp pilus assembly protein TadD
MKKAIKRQSSVFGAVILLLSLSIAYSANAGPSDSQVCDVDADYSLGIEDYPATIRLHTEVVRKRPDDALAHYHLGFAQGMVGNKQAELREYRRAASLGLKNWDLFLNLGLAEAESGNLDAATASLEKAVLLGQNHPESHYNLALVEVRRGILPDAEREILASLRLDPRQPDAQNLLGVIYAERGDTVRASLLWQELLRNDPGYRPARTNLTLLGSQSKIVLGGAAAAVSFTPRSP